MTRNEPPTFDPALYDADFFTWTRRQAAALRAMAPDASIDIEHVAEEIEDLGRRDLREVGSFLSRLLGHLLKLDAYPDSRDRRHWLSEAVNFHYSAVAAFTPGMRRLLDIEKIWAQGRKRAAVALGEDAAATLPTVGCPFDLDTLLSDDFDFDAALAELAAARDTPRP